MTPRDRPNQLWRVRIYRDDSETTIVIDNVKHAFLTGGNTILTIAVYASGESHFYVNWPLSRVCWWVVERA